MKKKLVSFALAVLLLVGGLPVQAQQQKVYRIGVLFPGGPLSETVDGLRKGLKELGFEEGKQFTLTIRDTKGDAKAAADAARTFEQEKVQLDIRHRQLCHRCGQGSNAERPHRFLHRHRSGSHGISERLRETRRTAHRRSFFSKRLDKQAVGDPERAPPEAPGRGDRL